MIFKAAAHHSNVVTSLILREIITRYGRRGLGFFWLVGEPMMFTVAIIILWSFIKAPYQHGIRIAPFVMTGYMCLIMFRHMVSYSMAAVSGNTGLLYHKNISVLHVYMARYVLEFFGSTLAFFILYTALLGLGQVGIPHNLLLVYWGWFSLFVLSMGIAMVLSALAAEFEILERIVPIMLYAVLPFSGVFAMAAWIPAGYRDVYLAMPLPHPVEMIRAGVFGEFVETHYDPIYPVFCGAILIVFGLLLLARAKEHLDAD
jgi:capsular polysaccharide transport system permease protein